MKQWSFYTFLLGSILINHAAPLYASASVVYNLKIAETTKRPLFEKNGEHPSSIALTPFNQFRNKYSGSRHNYGGTLMSYIYSPENYYARVDWACAQINTDHGTFVRGQTDDLLFSSGYSFSPTERAKCTVSGLFGIPTHKEQSITHAQFGYAHIGLGLQLDGSLLFSDYTDDHSLRWAVRAVHFLKRTTRIDGKKYTFWYGTLVDLYTALHNAFGAHRCDIGCNPTFLVASSISPSLERAVKRTEYKRMSFFGVYKYKFTWAGHPTALACALSYGFDFIPKDFGNKRIVTVWGLWSLSF